MKAVKTTFEVDGIKEPCYLVSSDDDCVQVRIHKCYHYIGSNSIYVTEFLDGDFNSREEIDGDFDSLSLAEAKRIAKRHSAYLS